MSGYVWLTWLGDALRAEGCVVAEDCGDWAHRGRPASTGSFDPLAAGWHHTGTTASTGNPFPTRSTLINGRSDLPGPLCHVGIDYNGVCHLIAAGRANHAGESNGWGPTSSGDGNAQLVGFEIDYDGTQPMSAAQRDAASRASAAVLRRLDHDAEHAGRHAEWSTTGKWDTGGVTGSQIRSMVAAQLVGGSTPTPTHQEVDMFYGTDSTGQGWLCNGVRKQRIKSPAYRDTILKTGVPQVGGQSSDFWSQFPTDQGMVDLLNKVDQQTRD